MENAAKRALGRPLNEQEETHGQRAGNEQLKNDAEIRMRKAGWYASNTTSPGMTKI
jgi:hypothetical protein